MNTARVPQKPHDRGYAESREQAMATFKAAWEQHKNRAPNWARSFHQGLCGRKGPIWGSYKIPTNDLRYGSQIVRFLFLKSLMLQPRKKSRQHLDRTTPKIPTRGQTDGDSICYARLLSAMILLRIGLSTNKAKATTTMFIKAVTTNTACQLP